MAITESQNPYANQATLIHDIANLQALLALVPLGANLTEVDQAAIDSITIRLLRWAECNRDEIEVERYMRLRAALRARFVTG
jgi:hypothetical protein